MALGLRRFFFNSILKKNWIIKLLDNIFYFSNIDIEIYFKSMDNRRRMSHIRLSLLSIGVGYRNSNPLKSEDWFIRSVLKNLIPDEKNIILFDVGANVGDYSKILCSTFPRSQIFSFEPNPVTFSILAKKLFGLTNVNLHRLGFSSEEKCGTLHSYENDLTSGHASLLKGVFIELYKNNSTRSFSVDLKMIDTFCFERGIHEIHFLKIDTEGYELEVLNGAREMISSQRIFFIQFEFNEMNIVNRIYLKDFFDLLDGYSFFRISDGELIDISSYKTEYEIFWYQDIFAVNNSKIDILESLLNYKKPI